MRFARAGISDSRRLFNGLAESRAVRKARIARRCFPPGRPRAATADCSNSFQSLCACRTCAIAGRGWAPRRRRIEVPRFDDAGVDRPDRNLKHAFAQGRPVDVLFALERRQHGVDGKVLAQRVNVGPIVMQCDAAGVGVPIGHQAEPILNLALLPVDSGTRQPAKETRGSFAETGARARR